VWRVNANPLEQTPVNQWAKNHILTRFTILSLSDSRLEIRLKTYAGEKKYSALFVEGDRPLITTTNLDAINEEYKTLKTCIYTFRKE
jgi:CMP-2-keto-3-deoxyoctulosonic acid synthetase